MLKSTFVSASIIIILICCTSNVFAQDNSDSTIVRTHSPKKATLLALIPGAGQIYNKKYWKLPIVYAGFAVTGYYAFYARGHYLKFNEAYICKLNDPDNCDLDLAIQYDIDKLEANRDFYRRNMELSFILMAAWYVLQILDASVDAHLYYWNVNDDLSLKVEPLILQPNMYIPQAGPMGNTTHNGLKISVNF